MNRMKLFFENRIVNRLRAKRVQPGELDVRQFEMRESFNRTTTRNSITRFALLSVFALIVTLAGASTGTAATVTSAGDGPWNSTTPNAPWPGGTVPSPADDVIIRPNDNITVTTAATIN